MIGPNLIIVGDGTRTGSLKDYDHACHGSANCLEADMPNLGFEHIISEPRFNLDTVINDYGKELVSLCINSGMCIVNGRTVGDKDGMFTRLRVHKTGNGVLTTLWLASNV